MLINYIKMFFSKIFFLLNGHFKYISYEGKIFIEKDNPCIQTESFISNNFRFGNEFIQTSMGYLFKDGIVYIFD